MVMENQINLVSAHTLPLKDRWFTPPTNHKPRAKLPIKMMNRLRSAYHFPQKVLTELQRGPTRQVRAERRNVCLDMLSLMVYRMDDATGRLGRLINGTWTYLSIQDMANQLCVPLKRAQRAFKMLVKCDYIAIRPNICATKNGILRAEAAPKILTPKFFTSLGFSWGKITKFRQHKEKDVISPPQSKQQPITDQKKKNNATQARALKDYLQQTLFIRSQFPKAYQKPPS